MPVRYNTYISSVYYFNYGFNLVSKYKGIYCLATFLLKCIFNFTFKLFMCMPDIFTCIYNVYRFNLILKYKSIYCLAIFFLKHIFNFTFKLFMCMPDIFTCIHNVYRFNLILKSEIILMHKKQATFQ